MLQKFAIAIATQLKPLFGDILQQLKDELIGFLDDFLNNSEPLTQEDINGMSFDQLRMLEQDHEETIAQIKLEQQYMQAAREALTESLLSAEAIEFLG